MFWRRKRRQAAEAAAGSSKAPSQQPDEDKELPFPEEPATSGSGEDMSDVVMMEDDDDDVENGLSQEEKKEEDEESEASKEQDQPIVSEADLSPEERLERKREEAMRVQKVQETQALARNSFCKNQRVQYLHKASGRQYEAVVVDVHFDDGIDRPYFTIRYQSGSPPEMIEKQTTIDRLSYVAFDEAKTYDIISTKIKL